MADILVEDRYRFDLNADAAIKEIAKLANEVDQYSDALDKAKASGKSFDAEQKALEASARKLNTVINQEVKTLDGINAKRNLLRGTLSNLTKGTQEYNAVLGQVNQLENQVSAGTANLAQSSGGFLESITGGYAAIAAAAGAALDVALRVGSAALDEYAKKQEEENNLLAALQGRTEVQQRLLDQADQLEKKTLFDGGDIVTLQTYLANLGLTEEQIKKNVNASVELSAVTGKDLTAANSLLIAAQNGQIRGLAKLVPEVKNLTKAQLANGDASDLVAQKFKGAAEAQNTGLKGLKNTAIDLKNNFLEDIGESITKSGAKLLSAFTVILQRIFGGDASSALIKAKDTIIQVFDALLSYPSFVVASINGLISATLANFEFIKNEAELVFLALKENALQITSLFGNVDEALNEVRRRQQELRDQNKDGYFSTIANAFKKGYDDALKNTDEFNKAFTERTDKDYTPKPDGKKGKKEIDYITGSLADLEKQLSKLKEQVEKQVKAGDRDGLGPVLTQIKDLEEKIKDARKVQEGFREALAKPLSLPIDKIAATTKQTLSIQESLEKETLARRLNDLERNRQQELNGAVLTALQKKVIDERYQRERERLERETNRRLISIAIQQKNAELAAIQKNLEPGQVTEQTAKISADIAELNKQLTDLGAQEVNVVIVPPDTNDFMKRLKEIGAEIATLTNQVISSLSEIYSAQAQRIENAVQKQQQAYDTALQNSEKFNAQQIELERDRLDKLQQEQQKAAEKARAIQIAQLAANSIIAIAKAAAEGGIAAPFTISATLIALAAGIIQARSAANNAFFEGTEYLTRRNGERPGRDTIPIWANEGEAIIPTETNKKYSKAVKAIYRNSIPPEVLNAYIDAYSGGGLMPLAKQLAPYRYSMPDAESLPGTSVSHSYNFRLKKLEDHAEQQTAYLRQIAANSRQSQPGRTDITTPKRDYSNRFK